MARLIDADKLDWWYKGRPIRRVIDEAPTVDAVEVVRCKDCKNRGNDVSCPMCWEEMIEWDDDGYHEIDFVTHDYTTDNGFCHLGERKTDND